MIHPGHTFDEQEAIGMITFNDSLATLFDTQSIEFDYFTSSNTNGATEIMGYDFTPKKYEGIQYGGLADVPNRTIYAGNNSEDYPHELIHLYTFQYAPNQHHRWIDEGIATYFGLSGGHSLNWHL